VCCALDGRIESDAVLGLVGNEGRVQLNGRVLESPELTSVACNGPTVCTDKSN